MNPESNYYDVLQVHPAAPLDLISAAYWRLVNRAQNLRGKDASADMALYALTNAYRTLIDPVSRQGYDRAIGLKTQPVAPRLRPLKRSFFGRLFSSPQEFAGKPDFYEILRLHPAADPAVVDDAHELMRNYYVRLVRSGHTPIQLLQFLEEAHAVLSDPATRALYDAERSTIRPPSNGHSPTSGSTPPEQHVPPAEAAPVPPPTNSTEEIAPVDPAQPAPADGPSPALIVASAAGRAARALAAAIASAAAAVARASGRWLARNVPIAGGWLATHVPVAARWLGRVLQTGPKSARESIRCWWEAAMSDDDPPAIPKARVVTPVVPLPEEEEAVVARLKAGSNGHQPGIEDFPMRACLTLIHAPSGERTFEIDRSPLLLGADGHADIPLPGMAAHEARLIYREGQFILFSLTDVRGINLNGEAVAWAVLEDGVEVAVGPYTLRFDLAPR